MWSGVVHYWSAYKCVRTLIKKAKSKRFSTVCTGSSGSTGGKKRRKIGNKDTKIKKDINRKKWKIQKKVVKIDKLGIIEDKSYRIQKLRFFWVFFTFISGHYCNPMCERRRERKNGFCYRKNEKKHEFAMMKDTDLEIKKIQI